MDFPGGSVVKDLPAMQETQDWPLGQEDPLEMGMVTCSSTLAWEIPRTEEPRGLQSIGLQRVRHDLVTKEHQREWHSWTLKDKSDGGVGGGVGRRLGEMEEREASQVMTIVTAWIQVKPEGIEKKDMLQGENRVYLEEETAISPGLSLSRVVGELLS